MPSKSLRKTVHGDDLLYEFFQNSLSGEGFEGVPELLLKTMGVWLPLDVYFAWPVLLPFVVRDPDCRPRLSLGRLDAWSSPDGSGYLRDDNSLIKGLPRALEIRGPKGRRVSGARMGNEFVAAHVWRQVDGGSKLASRMPNLNSFVPNLVWLPKQIAKLTDREGGTVQHTAQAMAIAIYRQAPVAPHLQDLVEGLWSQLPTPSLKLSSFDLDELNWFRSTPRFLATRQQRVEEVIAALVKVSRGQALTGKVVASRYTDGLALLNPKAAESLRHELQRFIATTTRTTAEDDD